jgi:hypothetical protein
VYGTNSWETILEARLLHKVLKLVMMGPAQATTAMADVFACSRYIYGLSRGGFIPTQLSVTYPSSSLTLEPEENSQSGSNGGNNEPSSQTNSATSPPSLVLPDRRRTTSTPIPRTTRSSQGFVGTGGGVDPESAFRRAAELAQAEKIQMEIKARNSPSRCPTQSVWAAAGLCLMFNILIEMIRSRQAVSNSVTASNVVDDSADKLLRMAVWFACLGYLVQLASYIVIRIKMKTLQRPSPSPTGILGAAASLVLAIVFGLVGPFFLPDTGIYPASVVTMICFGVVFFIYYQIYALPRLTNSPERLFILCVSLNINFPGEIDWSSLAALFPCV